MNRFMLLMVMVFFLILITITANSLLPESAEMVTDGVEVGRSNTFGAIFNMMKTFFKIVTFQIDEFPVILNITVFMPLTVGVIYIIIDILKDLVPFT